jgi:PEP-CTERM motif
MRKVALLAIAATAMVPVSASAATFVVDANKNTAGGGVGAQTITLTAGQGFSVSVDPSQLWSAGALPRWSNAEGLSRDFYATGDDLSQMSAGTLIGQFWGYYGQDNILAPYGTLFGRIGNSWYNIGTSYSGVAASNGVLELFFWDFDAGDNVGSLSVNAVASVPEPSTWAMMLSGFGLAGFALRRRSGKRFARVA